MTDTGNTITASHGREHRVDIVIAGGGIAGLWLLNRLSALGYSALLFEAGRLGGEQTLASQGMIHGGLKYALGGALTGASEAIAAMPERWRACLRGEGEVDLSGLPPLSHYYYLYAADNALGSLTSFFASRGLRGRIERVQERDYPQAFADGFSGRLYRLNDFVLDTAALVARLAQPVRERIFQHSVEHAECSDEGVRLDLDGRSLVCTSLIVAAGTGSERLCTALGIDQVPMQRRPLHQVVVRHDYPHPIYAHCLTGIKTPEPRLTITSHPTGRTQRNRWLWYLGGRLATSGVDRTQADQIAHARDELKVCIPWVDLDKAEFSTLRVDRAEPAQHRLLKPDNAYAKRVGQVLVCWPTKLSLAPDLGDRVLAQLPPPAYSDSVDIDLPRPPPATPPWV